MTPEATVHCTETGHLPGRLRALARQWYEVAEQLPTMAAALADAYPDFPTKAAARSRELEECAEELLNLLCEPPRPELVGLTEIGHRAGVTNAAVANWATRHSDFPEPVAVLRCGSIWEWPTVADWLTRNDMPDHEVRPLAPAAIKAATVAAKTPRQHWGGMAVQCRISLRELCRAVVQQEIGEEFGWFTRQRRSGREVKP